MARHDTLFSIRYAVRVLERHCKLWSRVDVLLRFLNLIAGTSAIAALSAQNLVLTLIGGLIFACAQALEVALKPAETAAKSMAQRKLYASLYARQRKLDDDALSSAYDELVADDEIIVTRVLRELAYNDVIEERGNSAADGYPVRRLMTVFSVLT